MSKERLDIFLVKNGFFQSRERAKAEIMAGNVLINNQKIEKAGSLINVDSEVTLLKKDFPYVSRGALKLLKAFAVFPLDVEGKTALDIGASTGGFTEILLLNGASLVYSVDVGYNQLAWSLRQDPRVVVLEKLNGRILTPDHLNGDMMDIVVTDVSFISLDKILPQAFLCLKDQGEMVALIKPQFEAGKDGVNKKGVVTEASIRMEVVLKIIKEALAIGFSVLDLAVSPLKGPKGNIEYLIYLQKNKQSENHLSQVVIEEIMGSKEHYE